MVANEMLTFGELLIIFRANERRKARRAGYYGEVISRFNPWVSYTVDSGARVAGRPQALTSMNHTHDSMLAGFASHSTSRLRAGRTLDYTT